MSAEASREAFEAWAKSEEGGYQSCTKAGAHDIARTYWSFSTDEQWIAWQASRKQALADAAALCRSLDNGDRQTTPTNCAEEIEVLK